jgi:hypothetical protein
MVQARLAWANMDGTIRQTPAVNETVNLQGLPEFQALPEPVRNKLFEGFNKDPQLDGQVSQLVHQPLYGTLSTEQKTKLLNVFAGANSEGRQELVTLMTRQLNGGTPALLSRDNSSNQATLLDNFDKLATEQLDPAVAGRRPEILSDVIEETSEPTWYLDQGSVGTCAPTSLQTHLIVNAPAEYARLLGGLLGKDRKATMADGSDMTPAMLDLASPATVTPSGGSTVPDKRSLTERVFQSALAQHTYLHTSDWANYPVNASGDIGGFRGPQTATALSALYGRPYKSISGSAKDLESALNKGGPVPAGISWGTGGHAVVVDKIVTKPDGTKMVYFRNPWGSSDAKSSPYRDGQQLGTVNNSTNAGPLRVVVDHQSGLEAMTLSAFAALMNHMEVPD